MSLIASSASAAVVAVLSLEVGHVEAVGVERSTGFENAMHH